MGFLVSPTGGGETGNLIKACGQCGSNRLPPVPDKPAPQEGVESIFAECYLIGTGGRARATAAILGKTAEKAMGSIANVNGGTTLEMLLAERKIIMPAWDPTNPAVVRAWQNVSAEYAANASGTVRAVIGKKLHPGNVWESAELPVLMDNQKITSIITIDPAATLVGKTIYVRK